METATRAETMETGAVGSRLRRRGLIAGAAALIAGIAAKQASTPVEASDLHISDFTASAVGTVYKITNSGSGDAIEGLGTSGGIGGYASGSNGIGVFGNAPNGTGVHGRSFGTNQTGTFGEAPNGSSAKGVYGTAGSGYGVYGQTTAALGYGVTGIATDGYGVTGSNSSTSYAAVSGYNGNSTSSAVGVNGVVSAGTGTLGQSGTGIGVRGTGVYGVVGTVPNAANSIAVNASNTSTTGTGNLGVYGSCTSGYGILGVSSAGAPFSGITGAVYTASGAAFAGGASQPGAFAAYFTGKVNIDGPFYVNGVQRFTLKHADGTSRLVAGVQSPDPWVEDFGTGTLASGVASVTLDPDFAAIAEVGTYYVFPVAQGDSKGLYVTNQTATGFEVREQQGGTSSIPFAYRIVAKPKETGGKVARLAKYEPPNITIPGVNGAPLPAVTLPPLPPPAPEKERGSAPQGPQGPLAGGPAPAPAPPPRAAAPAATTAAPQPAAAPDATAAPAAPGGPNPAPAPPARR